MPGNVFLSALQEITAGRAGLGELITAAAQLQGAGEALLAEQLYKVWIGLNPDHPQLFIARFNCSSVQQGRGDVDGAQASLEAALAQNPDFHPAYINLGGILERAGAPEPAMDQWRAVIDRLPAITATAIDHKLIAMKQIGRVLLDHQKQGPAEAVLRQALDVRADQRDVLEQYTALRLAQCEWPVVVPWDGVDHKTLMGGISPLSSAAYTDDPLLQLGAGHRYAELAVDAGGTCPDADRRGAAIALEGRRLRIGYVSSDLRDHAIGYLMAELFEVHDKSKVEVFAYYCGPDPQGALNTRILAAVEHWVDINPLDDDAAARRIAADGIDILVDVNGLTRSARTAVFARRPAPVQVNWLGFPGSMASPYHQYVIADDYIIPQGSELYYSEAVLRLPCYQPNDRKRIVVAQRPTRAEVGLPEDAFVFCCFNGVQKITRFTYDRWLEILRRTPNSLLWLLESSPEINERLWAYAAANGVERGRIVFAPKQQNAYHLARYPLADLFLDTAPYGAHTTASDALWMGVPVLTLTGRGFAARVCGSLVRSAGLPELICETGEAFVERAVALGSDPAAVHALKARLEANRATCVLFDMELLAARLEDLYAHMAAEHQAGRTPQPNLTNLDAYHRAGTEEDHEAQEMRAVEDYHGLYRAKLARRHRQRSLPADGRLWDGQG